MNSVGVCGNGTVYLRTYTWHLMTKWEKVRAARQLDPDLSSEPFTVEEDKCLLFLHNQFAQVEVPTLYPA